ncbi:MAG: maleylpyruvate isomerase N-terminal domain-containing protein [Acidimicrobiales bacterium]
MDLDDEIAGCAAAHQRLLATLDGLTDDAARRPSELPDWSVGHVLTHVARNADSFVRVVEAAADGRVVDRYVDGVSGRNADIETGARRPAVELVDDVRSTIWRLEQTWATAPTAAWAGTSREISGREIPITDAPFLRWREVEVHHADLGLGFTFDDWSDAYVDAELTEQLAKLPARLVAVGPDPTEELRARLGDRRLLAWLLGRWSDPDLPELTSWG